MRSLLKKFRSQKIIQAYPRASSTINCGQLFEQNTICPLLLFAAIAILLALGITCGKTIGCRAFGLFLYVDLGIATAKIGLIFASRRTINAVKIKCFGLVLARLEKLRSLPFNCRYGGEPLCPHRFQ